MLVHACLPKIPGSKFTCLPSPQGKSYARSTILPIYWRRCSFRFSPPHSRLTEPVAYSDEEASTWAAYPWRVCVLRSMDACRGGPAYPITCNRWRPLLSQNSPLSLLLKKSLRCLNTAKASSTTKSLPFEPAEFLTGPLHPPFLLRDSSQIRQHPGSHALDIASTSTGLFRLQIILFFWLLVPLRRHITFNTSTPIPHLGRSIHFGTASTF